MARAVRAGEMTPADELRALLSDSERLLANLKGDGAAVQLLDNMDRIAELWPQLEAAGVDLRPEAGRWETIQALAHKQGGTIVREVRPAGGLAALRAKREMVAEPAAVDMGVQPGRNGGAEPSGSPAPVGWWWHLDREVSERRRRKLTRFGVTALIVVVVLAAGSFLLGKFFPVDPAVVAASAGLSAGQQKIDNQKDYQGALADFQAASRAQPNQPDAWLWIGAVQEKLGNAAASREAFDRARAVAGGDLNFYLGRTPIYSELGMYDQARADVNAALKIDPENATAYYMLATIEEDRGNMQAAAAALDKSSTYAEARKQTELVAMARFRLGMLMQRMQVVPSTTDTPTP
jgi:tetratricopeptide (TPR) repeat protein